MVFVLPSKREAGVLMNSDLAQEWGGENRVVMSDGTEIAYNPPPAKLATPDWSEIKSIRHYFNRTYKNNHWPAWIYNHTTNESRIVKDAHEAAEFGICYRERTSDERARFGEGNVWDWKDDCDWRPTPKQATRQYDARRPEQGKEFIATPVAQSTANRDLLNTVLPEVTAAVVAALKQGGNVNPANVDPKQWDEFLAFQAWKKTQEAVDTLSNEISSENAGPALSTVVSAEDERGIWEEEAKSRNIKVDGRWSLARLKEEVEKSEKAA